MIKKILVTCDTSGLSRRWFRLHANSPCGYGLRAEAFSAMAYLPTGAGMRMVGAGATANLTIYVEKYTSDEEAQQYAQTLLQQGPDELLKALEKGRCHRQSNRSATSRFL
jgi:hypothetical protein